MKVVRKKVRYKAPKGFFMQMRFLPALEAIVTCSLRTAVRTNYFFIVVMGHTSSLGGAAAKRKIIITSKKAYLTFKIMAQIK